jgi:two-component system chemotaxis response regulator CheY
MEPPMSKRILTVDDSKTMRSMVACTLKAAGFEVMEAEDGVAGLRLLKSGTLPDIILTDLNMPNMDGFAFISAVRSEPAFAHIPILLLTTESSTQDKERGKALGAAGWLGKPFNTQKLVQVIHKVCS